MCNVVVVAVVALSQLQLLRGDFLDFPVSETFLAINYNSVKLLPVEHGGTIATCGLLYVV